MVDLAVLDVAGHVLPQIVRCWAEAALGGAAAREGVAEDAGPVAVADDSAHADGVTQEDVVTKGPDPWATLSR